MPYTLWRQGRLIGEADLEPKHGTLAGPFRPTAEYAEVQGYMRAVFAAQAAMIPTIPAGADGAVMAAHLTTHPAGLRAVAANQVVESLGLSVLDPSGRRLDDVTVLINEWSLLDHVPPEDRDLMSRLSSEDREMLEERHHLAFVTPRGARRASDAGPRH